MKKLLLAGLAFAALSASGVASAATVTSNFDVTVNLAGRCVATTSGTPVMAFGSYDALGTTAGSATAVLTFNCTRFLAAPVVSFNAAGGATTGNPSTGVIAGLQYTVTAVDVVTGGSPASSTSVGTPDIHTYTLTGAIPAGQAGDCGSQATLACSATTTVNRMMTLTY